jgi:radical SAM superfamily enzyme YgiQ (UPF0313 family)
MRRPKLQIIVLFQNLGAERAYYARSPSPPLSGLLLAGLTPPTVAVEVLHEMVRPIDYGTDADFIALSFMDYCAPHAVRVAREFRRRGKVVVAGGRYATTFPDAIAPHVDAVVVGEAERVWARVVGDLVAGTLRPRYAADRAPSLANIPPPRYDLAEPAFSVPVVTEATRGCPFKCTYCQLNIDPTPFRTRPIPDVIRDLEATQRLPFAKRKIAMLYDNNLGGDMAYAKELLREIAKLKLWALGVQFSLNCLQDEEFVDLLAAANCRMAFLGMESLNQPSLAAMEKNHNRVAEYREHFAALRRRGILVFAGTMLALDEDTAEYYDRLPELIEAVDPAAIFVSLAIPIPGTPFHRQVAREGRILDVDLAHYDGDHLVLEPARVTPEVVLEAAVRVRRSFYSWRNVGRRWGRLLRSYLGDRRFLRRIPAALMLGFILWQLSVFQRAHTRRRFEPLVAEARRRGWSAPTGAPASPPRTRSARPAGTPAPDTAPRGSKSAPPSPCCSSGSTGSPA